MEPNAENSVTVNNAQAGSTAPIESVKYNKIKITVSCRDLIILLPIFFFLEIGSELYFNFFTSSKNLLLPFIFLTEIATIAFYLILLTKGKQKLFIPMLLNLALIVLAKFILMSIHPLYWEYRGYGNQGIEMGWFFLAPVVFIFYSLIIWSFSFITGSLFSKSFKKLEILKNPPILDIKTVSILTIIVTGLLLVFIYLNNWENKHIAEYDAFNNQQLINKESRDNYEIRNEFKSRVTPSTLQPSSLHTQ